jgi:tetratricopeptide (TPR) repeat protein
MRSLATTLAMVLALGTAAAPHALAHGDLHHQIEDVSAELRRHPRDAALYHKRGELQRAHHDYKAALADYARAERLDPRLHVVHLSRGRTLLESGKPERAQRALTVFLAQEPEHAEALLLRARAFAQLGRTAEAEADFAHTLARMADPLPDLFLERAANLAAAGRTGEALAALESGMARLGALVTLEEAALDLELADARYDAALARIDRMLQAAPIKAFLLARKALVLDRAGRAEAAAAARLEARAAIAALPEGKRHQPRTRELEQQLNDAELTGTARAQLPSPR